MKKNDSSALAIIITAFFLFPIAIFVALAWIISSIYKKTAESKNGAPRTRTTIHQNSCQQHFTSSEQKHVAYVQSHSKTFQKISEINQKYSFHKFSSQTFTVNCSTLREYNNIDPEHFLKLKIEENLQHFKHLTDMNSQNICSWYNYQNECQQARNFLSEAEIKNLPNRKIRVKTFQSIEQKLYTLSQLTKPTCSFSISAHISYTSPQGRNHYNKSEIFTHNMLEHIFSEIEGQILQRKKDAELLKEREQQLLLEKAKQDLLKEEERRRKREERAREQAEQRREKKEYNKLYKQLQEEAEMLHQREEEFKAATQGHIYSTAPPPAFSNQEPSEPVSMWAKLKRLKTQFDNGEITHIEYEEKRQALLRGEL